MLGKNKEDKTKLNMENTEVKAEVKAEVTQETPAPKTYTEGDVKNLVKQSLDEQYNKLNKKLSEQGAEIARLRKQPPMPAQDDSFLNVILSEKKERAKAEGITDPAIAQLEAELSRRKAEAERQRVALILEDKKAEVYGQLKEAGVDITDDAVIADVENTMEDEYWMGKGEYKRTERVIKKILKTHKPAKSEEKEVPDKKVETEAQMRERIEREVLEKHGLLKPETANPSSSHGRIWTQREIDDMPMAEYKSRKAEMDAAEREGRIKKK